MKLDEDTGRQVCGITGERTALYDDMVQNKTDLDNGILRKQIFLPEHKKRLKPAVRHLNQLYVIVQTRGPDHRPKYEHPNIRIISCHGTPSGASNAFDNLDSRYKNIGTYLRNTHEPLFLSKSSRGIIDDEFRKYNTEKILAEFEIYQKKSENKFVQRFDAGASGKQIPIRRKSEIIHNKSSEVTEEIPLPISCKYEQPFAVVSFIPRIRDGVATYDKCVFVCFACGNKSEMDTYAEKISKHYYQLKLIVVKTFGWLDPRFLETNKLANIPRKIIGNKTLNAILRTKRLQAEALE